MVFSRQPVLFVQNDEDHIRGLFPNAEFYWVKGGGHWIQTDNHEEFMAKVVPFLES